MAGAPCETSAKTWDLTQGGSNATPSLPHGARSRPARLHLISEKQLALACPPVPPELLRAFERHVRPGVFGCVDLQGR